MSYPPPSGVEMKTTSSGEVNPKYIDLLEEDKPIAGQKFACLSFVSPEHILKQKDHFFFEKFLTNIVQGCKLLRSQRRLSLAFIGPVNSNPRTQIEIKKK